MIIEMKNTTKYLQILHIVAFFWVMAPCSLVGGYQENHTFTIEKKLSNIEDVGSIYL
jgi:hypothetical protein